MKNIEAAMCEEDAGFHSLALNRSVIHPGKCMLGNRRLGKILVLTASDPREESLHLIFLLREGSVSSHDTSIPFRSKLDNPRNFLENLESHISYRCKG